jgi:hypothetical protein
MAPLICFQIHYDQSVMGLLENQRARVQIPVVSRSFCDEQLQLLTSRGCLCILLSNLYMYNLCMFIRYLVSITQVLNDINLG